MRRGSDLTPKDVAGFDATSPDSDGERPEEAGKAIHRGVDKEVREVFGDEGMGADFDFVAWWRIKHESDWRLRKEQMKNKM
jgi:hypothetical protein